MKHAMILVVLAACVEHKAGVTGTQSLGVELMAPADPGDVQHRLPAGAKAVTVNVTAYDPEFEIDTSFNRKVQVYVQYLGTLTPSLYTGAAPLAEIVMTNGRATNQTVMLPPVFGPTNLWIEDGTNGKPTPGTPTYATGASPTLWFRDPTIADIQTPPDETALNALVDSPLENKQVSVGASRYGDVGRLVVTSVFAQGYTVSDVKCTDAKGTPPCTAAAYDHIEVFSFSAPTDMTGRLLKQGQVIDGFVGGISEFNGLTEVGFPGTFASDSATTPDRLPLPVKFDPATWFKPVPDLTGTINFERNEAAAIEIDNAKVCNLDSDFITFGQWKLDPSGVGGDCFGRHDLINVVTAGLSGVPDPATLVGKTLPRVVGMVRPVFTIWIIFPRSSADLTLQ